MFVCTTVLYEYMYSLRNDVCNLFINMNVRFKIYREFFHCTCYIANEGLLIRICDNNDFMVYFYHNICTLDLFQQNSIFKYSSQKPQSLDQTLDGWSLVGLFL